MPTCDLCGLPLGRMEEGASRCNHCWEVTSRLTFFLGSPKARELVAATIAEIGCAPRPCPACSANAHIAHFVAHHEDENDEEEFDRLIEIVTTSQDSHTCGIEAIVCQFCGSGERLPNQVPR